MDRGSELVNPSAVAVDLPVESPVAPSVALYVGLPVVALSAALSVEDSTVLGLSGTPSDSDELALSAVLKDAAGFAERAPAAGTGGPPAAPEEVAARLDLGLGALLETGRLADRRPAASVRISELPAPLP